MTTAAVRLARTLDDPSKASDPETILREGVVVQLGPPVQVDTGDLSLSCLALQDVAVGADVFVISRGNLNVIVGDDTDNAWGSAGFLGGFSGTWGNFGGTWKTLAIRRATLDKVEMVGLVAGGSSGALVTIATGWRPAADVMFPAVCAVAGVQVHARLEVAAAGGVSAIFAGGGTAQFYAVQASWTLD